MVAKNESQQGVKVRRLLSVMSWPMALKEVASLMQACVRAAFASSTSDYFPRRRSPVLLQMLSVGIYRG